MRVPFTGLELRRVAKSSSPTPPVATKPGTPDDPRLAAIERIRATVKWLIAGFAGLAAALAGESLLSTVGNLDLDDERLWLAIGAAGTGLLAVAVMIWATTNILLPAQVTLRTLAEDDGFAELVNENPELFRGYGSTLAEFVSEYNKLIGAHAEAAVWQRQHPDDDDAARRTKAAADAVRPLAPVVQRLVNQGLFEHVRRQFRRARWFIFAGALVAGMCLVLVAWAANPEEPAPTGTPQPLPPSVVSVQLSEEGEARLASSLRCARRPVRAVVVGGTTDTPTVVTLPIGGCAAVRFALSEQLGTAVER